MTRARRGDKPMAPTSPAWVYSMILALSGVTRAHFRYGSMDGPSSDDTPRQAAGWKNEARSMPQSTGLTSTMCLEYRGAVAPPRYEPVGCTFSGAAEATRRQLCRASAGPEVRLGLRGPELPGPGVDARHALHRLVVLEEAAGDEEVAVHRGCCSRPVRVFYASTHGRRRSSPRKKRADRRGQMLK